ncbi:response regulator [Flavobacterium antarcticum]|uniref:response regulator n=1 Tax=Flavobacterium antarcticum TaxID=271155 RepID=UPI0003B693CE|nr:response regulator [Flavobacterium antarcticum]
MVYNTIFHIDDDLDDCLIFRDAISEISDTTYIWENNPLKALEKLISGEVAPQLIFLDLNMPSLNGYELLSEISKHNNISVIPVIIFSTSLAGCTAESNSSNILMQFTKPSDYDELKAIMNQIIFGID